VKFEFVRGYELLRQIALRLEKSLGWEPSLVFQLEPHEVFSLLENIPAMAELALERQRKSTRDREVPVPAVIFSDRLEEIGKRPESEKGKLFYGIGVTSKETEGIAVVVRSPDDQEVISALRQGSILVTTTTDPSWSPMLAVVGRDGGLVTEVGGLLAHGAIYAREIGMAAVLNVPRITACIQTGTRIRISGKENLVEILD
jgi:pyruvate,water dikinase